MDRPRGFLAQNCERRRRKIFATVVLLAFLILAVLLAYTAFASPTRATDRQIQQVAIIFRHGDRTPTETYPNDPYVRYDWPDGWGALTKKGMLELYKLGGWIRENYGPVIGEKYRSSSLLIRSSYADRCIMSAQALLAGLYPLEPEDMFVPGLPWQPVPVHATPRQYDKLIVVKVPCPRLEAALEEAYRNETQAGAAEMASYLEKLTQLTGQPMKTITDVEFLYNTLEIEEKAGLQLPDWTKEYYNENMREIAARSLAIFTSNTFQRRLRGGPLLKEILEKMYDTKTKNEWRKAYLYSAHDITLVNVLRAMGFTNELFKPDYAAALIFELHLINGGQEHEVKALYLNGTGVEKAHQLPIPGCNDPCLLETLIETWKSVIPDDWDAECVKKI